jgi:hypothetical protein
MFYPYPGDMHVDRLSLSLFQLRVAVLAGLAKHPPFSPSQLCDHPLTSSYAFTSWLELASMGFHSAIPSNGAGLSSPKETFPCEQTTEKMLLLARLADRKPVTDPIEPLLLASV